MVLTEKKSRGGGLLFLRLRVLLLNILIISALILSASVAQAFNQNPSLNWGNTTLMDAALPPPGIYMSNYMVYYHADKFKDGNGDTIPGKNEVDVLVYTPQLIYVSPTKIGNLTWGFQALLPFINYTADTDIGVEENNDVIADLCFGPYIGGVIPFSANSRLHWFFDFDFYAPIGDYDNKKALNPSANYWTLEPFLALTLQLPHGFSITTRQHFTYNFKNDDYINPATGEKGDLQAGMLWHFNYDVMKTVDFISPNLMVGVAGYYGKQLNEDEFEGKDIPNSKEQKFAVGPAIWYLNSKGTVFSLRAYFESHNEANPEGEKFVARIIIPF
jgi:hypothetical protein